MISYGQGRNWLCAGVSCPGSVVSPQKCCHPAENPYRSPAEATPNGYSLTLRLLFCLFQMPRAWQVALPFFSAFSFMETTSEPALGSLMARAPMNSPLMSYRETQPVLLGLRSTLQQLPGTASSCRVRLPQSKVSIYFSPLLCSSHFGAVLGIGPGSHTC